MVNPINDFANTDPAYSQFMHNYAYLLNATHHKVQ
jgi:hypothetical protein